MLKFIISFLSIKQLHFSLPLLQYQDQTHLEPHQEFLSSGSPHHIDCSMLANRMLPVHPFITAQPSTHPTFPSFHWPCPQLI